jgi:hypothetical protein
MPHFALVLHVLRNRTEPAIYKYTDDRDAEKKRTALDDMPCEETQAVSILVWCLREPQELPNPAPAPSPPLPIDKQFIPPLPQNHAEKSTAGFLFSVFLHWY